MSSTQVEIQSRGRKGGAKKGNTNAMQFGHKHAQAALEKNVPFSALARDRQLEIQDRIHNSGLAIELHHRATRIATVADLYFDALLAKWDDLTLKQKLSLGDAYSRMDARAVRALKESGQLDATRPDRQFPDIINVGDDNGDS